MEALIVLLIYIFYPYLLYRLLKLKRYGFSPVSVLVQHLLTFLIFVFFGFQMACCGCSYKPVLETLLATLVGYWLPIFIMRYWRRGFTKFDRVWVKAFCPILYLYFYGFIYLCIEIYQLFDNVVEI